MFGSASPMRKNVQTMESCSFSVSPSVSSAVLILDVYTASKSCASITAFKKPSHDFHIQMWSVFDLRKIRSCHLLRLWKTSSVCLNLYADTLYLSYFLSNKNWTTEVVKNWVCYFRYWLESMFKYPSRIPASFVSYGAVLFHNHAAPQQRTQSIYHCCNRQEFPFPATELLENQLQSRQCL